MANANGEGSLYKRMREGRHTGYIGAVSYTDDAGKLKRHMVYGRTRADVQAKMKKVRGRIENRAPVKDSKQPLTRWLAQWRTTGLEASNRKDSTKELYANLSRRHLEPEPFGATPLDKLKKSDIEALIVGMKSRTKPAKRDEHCLNPEPVRALSDATIRQTYTVLRAALDGAVRDELLAKNPAAAVGRPGVPRKEAKYSSAVDVTKVLLCAEGLRYRNVLVLIAATGLRRGEALALHWSDIRFEAGELKVRGTLGRVRGKLVITEPKTERARRSVPLAPALVAMLRSHLAEQAAENLAAGDQWRDEGLVFATEFGTPVDPRNILRTIQIAAQKAGMAGVGVHTLRHSAAVAWLESGIHVKAVADLLGHSSVAITGDIYGHTSDDTARTAVEGLTGQLGISDF
jgi:integrase